MFSAIFTKGWQLCNLLFASMYGTVITKWVQHLKERICSQGANSFLEELTSIENGGKK